MKKPNFFIIGAPKGGTTALSEYLGDHPQVFFSEIKEPLFFSEDLDKYRIITNRRDYLRLFEGATEHHTVIGEGSVFYLWSEVAVPNILSFQHDARFVVMLRNPIDMVHSLHAQMVYSGGEDVTSFSEAWYLQGERREGRSLPRGCVEPKVFLYGELCLLGHQMERLYNTVSSQRVKVIFFEDFVNDTRNAYDDVLDFLDLESDERNNFSPVNTSKSLKSLRIEQALRDVYAAKKELGLRRGLGIGTWIKAKNTVLRSREPMDPDLRADLRKFFEPDIHKLANLTGRNLDHWIT